MSFLLLIFLLSDHHVKPMQVSLGDPILAVELKNMMNESLAMDQLLSDGLCFFLINSCGECETAVKNIVEVLAPLYPCFLIYLDEIPETIKSDRKINSEYVFSINSKSLRPYEIESFPALLVYREEKLIYAYHGPVDKLWAKKFGIIFQNHNPITE